MEERRKQTKKSFLAKAWVIRFVTSNSRSAHVIRIKPMHIIVTVVLAFSFTFGFIRHNTEKIKTKEAQLVALKESQSKKEMIIDRLKVERRQISGLLEKQNHEMATKLEAIEKKSNEVRKIVGLKAIPVNKKRSLKGSRSGSINIPRLRSDFRVLNRELNISKKEVDKLAKKAVAFKKEKERRRVLRIIESIPSIMPADGPVISDYGMRVHPIFGYMKFHSGIDVSSGYGSPIYSAAYGRVTYSGYYSGYGYAVIVDHDNGISTLYGHCSSLIAKEGEIVRKGQLIARVGSTGISTGPHLHYEVHLAGTAIDPMAYLDDASSRVAMLKKKYNIN